MKSETATYMEIFGSNLGSDISTESTEAIAFPNSNVQSDEKPVLPICEAYAEPHLGKQVSSEIIQSKIVPDGNVSCLIMKEKEKTEVTADQHFREPRKSQIDTTLLATSKPVPLRHYFSLNTIYDSNTIGLYDDCAICDKKNDITLTSVAKTFQALVPYYGNAIEAERITEECPEPVKQSLGHSSIIGFVSFELTDSIVEAATIEHKIVFEERLTAVENNEITIPFRSSVLEETNFDEIENFEPSPDYSCELISAEILTTLICQNVKADVQLIDDMFEKGNESNEVQLLDVEDIDDKDDKFISLETCSQPNDKYKIVLVAFLVVLSSWVIYLLFLNYANAFVNK